MTYLKDNGDEDIIPVLNSLGTEPESPAIKMRLYEKYICKEYSGDTMSEIDEAITCFSSQITYDEKNFLMADILSCIAIYGASPEEYFEFGFTGLNHLGRSEFLSDKQRFVL
ncbi:MAG: hypothetical protein IJU50_04310, partial [Lachnospiraceae bacterium]|nr:hypothetical protein [Lachnospiraceae bacterium]